MFYGHEKQIGILVLVFVVGFVCGYQYHQYEEKRELRAFFNGASKAAAQSLYEFFDDSPSSAKGKKHAV